MGVGAVGAVVEVVVFLVVLLVVLLVVFLVVELLMVELVLGVGAVPAARRGVRRGGMLSVFRLLCCGWVSFGVCSIWTWNPGRG